MTASPIASMTSDALDIAEADAAELRVTIEHLHGRLAIARAEAESHLERIDAVERDAAVKASQRDTFERALAHEREAGKGLVAQVEALRTESKHYTAIANHNAEIEDELRAIRDLVASGNPQGTVVDAVRAVMHALDLVRGDRDRANVEIAELRMGYVDVCDAIAPETHGPAHAASVARETRQERDAAIARAEAAERDARELRATVNGIAGRLGCAEDVGAVLRRFGDLCVEVDDLRAKVGEVAVLTATRDRLLAREHEDGRLHAQLRAELAELRARPVLTVKALDEAMAMGAGAGAHVMAKLGPVTLPSPDRAEELAATLVGTARASMTDVPIAWSCDFADGNENARRALTNVVRTALANLSPAPAPTFDAAFLRRVLVATKHGPNGKGGPGPCDAGCVKCEAERMAKAAPAREVAPALVAVSDEELVAAFAQAHLECPCDESGEEWAKYPPDCCNAAGIRAVRAKLGAAEVTATLAIAAAALCEHFKYEGHRDWSADARAILAHLRATAAKGG